MRRWLAAAASVALATGALAHAFVDRALPAVGSTVHGSPAEVRIWFTEQLESAFSSVKVEDAGGNLIAASEKAVDTSDSTLLRLPLPPLAPGKYRVVWRVLSVDSHVTSGDYTFDLEP